VSPGATRTEATICQHFDWKGLRTMVIAACRKCQLCQKAKLTNQKQGKLPAKQAEENPWDTLCVDLTGPCKLERKGKKDLKLWCLTVINPATGWFEMEKVANKTAAEAADICETTWFTRHPLLQRITLDQGTEFMAEFAKMVKKDHGLKLKPVTTRNPQANAIAKGVQQTSGNIIRTNGLRRSLDRDTSSRSAQCGAARCSAVRCGAAGCGTAWCGVLRHGTEG
jgi:hypothetical protein